MLVPRWLPKALVVLSVALLLLPSLVVSTSPSPQAGWHQSYSYYHAVGPSNAVFFLGEPFFRMRPGNEVRVPWQPFSIGLVWESTPTWFLRRLALIGPFASLEVLQQARTPGKSSISGPVPAQISPALANSWTNTVLTSVLLLPAHHQPGYYQLEERITTLDQRQGLALGVVILLISG